MKTDLATFSHKPLLIHRVETLEEAKIGYRDMIPKEGEGMLFCFDKQIPLPIVVSDKALDIVWLVSGIVVGIATHFGGILSCQADAALELPHGWCKQNGIKLGDRLDARDNGNA